MLEIRSKKKKCFLAPFPQVSILFIMNAYMSLLLVFPCFLKYFFLLSFFTYKIVEALVAMGYNRQDIEESLANTRYDDVFATYLLLGRKSTDVSDAQ